MNESFTDSLKLFWMPKMLSTVGAPASGLPAPLLELLPAPLLELLLPAPLPELLFPPTPLLPELLALTPLELLVLPLTPLLLPLALTPLELLVLPPMSPLLLPDPLLELLPLDDPLPAPLLPEPVDPPSGKTPVAFEQLIPIPPMIPARGNAIDVARNKRFMKSSASVSPISSVRK